MLMIVMMMVYRIAEMRLPPRVLRKGISGRNSTA